MNGHIHSLLNIPCNQRAKVISIEGGRGLQRRLQVMGIRKHQTIRVLCRQPLRGPLTIEAGGTQMTIGRGMAQKILVEVV